MSLIVNQNGQSVTSEARGDNMTPAAAPAAAPRAGIQAVEMQKIIGAYAQLKQLSSQTILSPTDEATKVGLINFLHSALLANCEELFGAWVAVNQEYSPLIQGFTALLNRALNRIDSNNRANAAVPAAVTEAPDKAS